MLNSGWKSIWKVNFATKHCDFTKGKRINQSYDARCANLTYCPIGQVDRPACSHSIWLHFDCHDAVLIFWIPPRNDKNVRRVFPSTWRFCVSSNQRFRNGINCTHIPSDSSKLLIRMTSTSPEKTPSAPVGTHPKLRSTQTSDGFLTNKTTSTLFKLYGLCENQA